MRDMVMGMMKVLPYLSSPILMPLSNVHLGVGVGVGAIHRATSSWTGSATSPR